MLTFFSCNSKLDSAGESASLTLDKREYLESKVLRAKCVIKCSYLA